MTTLDPVAVSDLSLFADLGTDVPREVATGRGSTMRMVRNGREIELTLRSNGSIVERSEEQERQHKSVRALLASPNFGDLGRWADAQTAFLKERVGHDTIPIFGKFNGDQVPIGLNGVDGRLTRSNDGDANNRIHVLLVDGPAGIGKTSLIRALAYDRAANYRINRRPLILHVESRGRVLQNIMDLMAFSLQTLRLNVTYDQVPALVRRGLITLAIDGFDELGDPNGYELAWAQVNDLVDATRGQGSLIFAGRETFIGRDRLIEALKTFNKTTDELHAYTVLPITPEVARDWLQKHGWTKSLFAQSNVEPLFEPGSYALRPFFLDELAKEGVSDKVGLGQIDDLMWFLVETMIDREATKFGRDIEAVTSEDQRRIFVRNFLGEVARDLADNQTVAISGDSIMWIAEVVASEFVPISLVGILKNRAGVVAFLTDDDRRGYRRFSHAQILNHFVARITIDAVCNEEVPKFIRRNIFSADLLGTFADVARNLGPTRISQFAKEAVARLNELGDQDRSRRNLASLVLAVTHVFEDELALALREVAVDEVLVTGTAGVITLNSVTMAQLDARSADLRAVTFGNDCYVISLIADEGTMLPDDFPCPQRIQSPQEVLTSPSDIQSWISKHSTAGRRELVANSVIPSDVREHELFDLLGRIARYRPFWIRLSDDKMARRILNDPYWDTLRDILAENELLTIRENLGASGRPSNFYHVRRKDELLSEDFSDTQISSFYRELVEKITETMN